MCANNKMYIFDAKNSNIYISDYDAVSLYPSAMSRVYFPAGECK